MFTRDELRHYKQLPFLISQNEKKLEKYRKKIKSATCSHVVGSSSEAPYTKRTFSVSGMTKSEKYEIEKDHMEYEELLRLIEEDKKHLEKLLERIDLVIAKAPCVIDKTILEYTKEGKDQTFIANKLYLTQQCVSYRLQKFISD